MCVLEQHITSIFIIVYLGYQRIVKEKSFIQICRSNYMDFFLANTSLYYSNINSLLVGHPKFSALKYLTRNKTELIKKKPLLVLNEGELTNCSQVWRMLQKIPSVCKCYTFVKNNYLFTSGSGLWIFFPSSKASFWVLPLWEKQNNHQDTRKSHQPQFKAKKCF